MPANQDSNPNQGGNKEFLEFLRSAPSLEDVYIHLTGKELRD